jgi:hypothetical protein
LCKCRRPSTRVFKGYHDNFAGNDPDSVHASSEAAEERRERQFRLINQVSGNQTQPVGVAGLLLLA